MLWAQMLVASAALPSAVLERLLLLSLQERGFSRGPLLVMDTTVSPGVSTSLLRVVQYPVFLLRTPVAPTADEAIFAEPVTGSIVILNDDVDVSSTLQSFLDMSRTWSRHWTIHSTLLVILISADRQRREYELSLQQIFDRSHVLDASVLVLDAHPQSLLQNTTTGATLYSWLRNLSFTNCTRTPGRLTVIGQYDLRGCPKIKFPTVVLPRKLPIPEEGCPLTALVYRYIPFAVPHRNEDGKEYFLGYEVSMLQLLAEIHGFPLRLVRGSTERPRFGTQLANGTWRGLPAEFAAVRADLAFGGIPAAACESNPLEATASYTRQSATWFTPRPEKLPSWYSVFSGPPANVILTLTALNVVVSLIIWVASSNRGVRDYSSYVNTCIAIFSASFSVPVRQPSVLSARVVFLSWILFSMAMETSVSSVITSHLSHPYFSRAITNDEELVQSGLRGASLPNIANFYPKFQKPGALDITETCVPLEECARRVAYDRDVAVLAPDVGFKYLGRTRFHDEMGSPLFTPLGDGVISSPTAMVLARGNPLAPLISDTILRIVEAGLLQDAGRPSAVGVATGPDNKDYLWLYFTVYFTTMGCWVVVLLGEITFNKWCHWCKRASGRRRLKGIKSPPSFETYNRDGSAKKTASGVPASSTI